METVYSGCVQSWGTLAQPVCKNESPSQIPQPAVDLTSNVRDEEFSTIESYTGENKVDSDGDVANLDMESLNLSDTDKSIPWAGLPLLMKHSTAGRPPQDVV